MLFLSIIYVIFTVVIVYHFCEDFNSFIKVKMLIFCERVYLLSNMTYFYFLYLTRRVKINIIYVVHKIKILFGGKHVYNRN